MEIKDSGARTQFSTGAVRDIQEGKGRCDLLPLGVVAGVYSDHILEAIDNFVCSQGQATEALNMAIRIFCAKVYNANSDTNSFYEGMLELSKHFEDGANKYGEYNWQKGIPVSRYIDSAVRHYLKYRAGWKDEPHDRAFLWNLVCCIWTVTYKADDLNDLRRDVHG